MTTLTGREAARNQIRKVRKVGEFEIGTIVRVTDDVTGKVSGPATIKLFYSDIEGGLRLDREIFGFVSWNVANCEIVK